ncbi:hypothetical protein C8R44DRAFT_870617 [Mycena epipterygia]|nr:hypothetical protein C8R44DRAFT_870617 [Mycena epipterygia]
MYLLHGCLQAILSSRSTNFRHHVLLSSLPDHIRRQQSDTIQLLRGDPSSSEKEHITTF